MPDPAPAMEEAAATDAPPSGQDAPEADGRAEDGAAPEEVETFYTFTWAPNRPARQGRGHGPAREAETGRGGKPGRGRGKPAGQKGAPRGDGKGPRAPKPDVPKTYAARPERKPDRIDPDNPFAAALMGLKDR